MPNDRRTANLRNVTATGAVSSNIIRVFWPTGTENCTIGAKDALNADL